MRKRDFRLIGFVLIGAGVGSALFIMGSVSNYQSWSPSGFAVGVLAVLFYGGLGSGGIFLLIASIMGVHKNCAEEHMVPLKLLVKRGFLIERGRCSRCHEAYKSIFLIIDKDLLSSRLRRFFICDQCATDNLDNWKTDYLMYHDSFSNLSPYYPIKTDLQCKFCREWRRKVVSLVIWDDLLKQS